MATRPLYQQYIDLIEELGGEVHSSSEGRKHVKIYFTQKGSNKERFYIAPKSPSDRRSLDNAKTTIRRLLSISAAEQPKFVEEVVTDEEEAEAVSSFGQRLRMLREQQQLSRARLADAAGLNVELIEHFEIMPKQPYLDYATMLKLSTALHTTLAVLTEGEAIEGVPEMSESEPKEATIPTNSIAIEVALGAINDVGGLARFMADRRNSLNLTQMEVAAALGQPYGSEVSKMERGLNLRLIQRFLPKLATVLQIPEPALKVTTERVVMYVKNNPAKRDEQRKDIVEKVMADHAAGHRSRADTEDILAAIRVEGRLTREMLTRQHEELIEAVKGAVAVKPESISDSLHGLIDHFFKRGP